MNTSNNRITDIASKDFWIQTWEETLEGTPFKIHSGYANPRFWDNAAEDYDRGDSEKRDRETARLTGRLEARGIDLKGARILDIGCGTGNLAIAFARMGADVTATDFSSVMLKKFEEKLDTSLKESVHPLRIDWEEVVLEDRGWRNAFDLVVAHMTPAVRRPAAFLKMLDASRGACLLKGWAGRRRNKTLAALWERIMGEPMRDRTPDVIFEFNLLYAMGYFPDMEIAEIKHDRDMTVADSLTRYTDYFLGVTDRPKDEIESLIRQYLEELAVDGIIHENTLGRTGTMVWKV